MSLVPQETNYSDVEPFKVPLVIHNDGLFMVYEMSLTCDDLRMHDFNTGNTVDGLRLHEAVDLPIGDLASNGFATTVCPGLIFGPPPATPIHKVVAAMTASVLFRPSFWPKRIEHHFYLFGEMKSDGRMHWMVVNHPWKPTMNY
jgi:hypothetical protein